MPCGEIPLEVLAAINRGTDVAATLHGRDCRHLPAPGDRIENLGPTPAPALVPSERQFENRREYDPVRQTAGGTRALVAQVVHGLGIEVAAERIGVADEANVIDPLHMRVCHCPAQSVLIPALGLESCRIVVRDTPVRRHQLNLVIPASPCLPRQKALLLGSAQSGSVRGGIVIRMELIDIDVVEILMPSKVRHPAEFP